MKVSLFSIYVLNWNKTIICVGSREPEVTSARPVLVSGSQTVSWGPLMDREGTTAGR